MSESNSTTFRERGIIRTLCPVSLVILALVLLACSGGTPSGVQPRTRDQLKADVPEEIAPKQQIEAAPKDPPKEIVRAWDGKKPIPFGTSWLAGEYARDVLAYQDKYGGKLVEIQLQPHIYIRKDSRGFYVAQCNADGQYDVFVYLTEKAARKLSNVMKSKTQKEESLRLLFAVEKEGFGFYDGTYAEDIKAR